MKIILLGNSGVGKTSIINKICQIPPPEGKTMGIDFVSHLFKLNDNINIKMQIWDASGQERFRSLIPSYIRDSYAVIFVYNISDRSSFLALEQFFEITKILEPSVIKLIIGNKFDSMTKREVSYEEAEIFAKEIGCLYIELNGNNHNELESAFIGIGEKYSKNEENEEAEIKVSSENINSYLQKEEKEEKINKTENLLDKNEISSKNVSEEIKGENIECEIVQKQEKK